MSGVTELAAGRGLLGLSAAPADLDGGLDRVAAWGAVAVVTLMEGPELEALGLGAIGDAVRRRGMVWHHWPIRDYGTPGEAFSAAWPERAGLVLRPLREGKRVLIHCRGGLGRTGTVAARLLVELGAEPDAAIAAVRAVRPGAIETAGQAGWVAERG